MFNRRTMSFVFDRIKSGIKNPLLINPKHDDSPEQWFNTGWISSDMSCKYVIQSIVKELINDLSKNQSVNVKTFIKLNEILSIYGFPSENIDSIIKSTLKKFMPIRIILRTTDQGLVGVTEESFSMSTSKSDVRIWWSGDSFSILGKATINGIEDSNFNAKPGDHIFDPFDPLCPVEIDWTSWLVATTKYSKRNAPFKIKVFEIEEEDACLR